MHEELLFQYEYIHRTGATNMFDMAAVQTLADIYEFDELAHLANDRDAYVEFVYNYTRPDKERYAEWLQCNGNLEDIVAYMLLSHDDEDDYDWETEDDLS